MRRLEVRDERRASREEDEGDVGVSEADMACSARGMREELGVRALDRVDFRVCVNSKSAPLVES